MPTAANTDRDSLSQRSTSAEFSHYNQPDTSSTLCQRPTSPSASSHSTSHSHNQQQHRTMATLSPSKARTTIGCGTTAVNYGNYLPHREALTPRSVLPEGDYSSSDSSHIASTSAVQAFDALNSEDTRDIGLMVATGNSDQGQCSSSLSCLRLSIDINLTYC